VAAGIVVVMLAAACAAPVGPVALITQPPTNVCLTARVGGVLVEDPTYGLAISSSDGHVGGTVWPNGFSAWRDEEGIVVLTSPGGQVVAREGDRIESAGHTEDDGTAYPCADIRTVEY
jgi:hypothetical protein